MKDTDRVLPYNSEEGRNLGTLGINKCAAWCEASMSNLNNGILDYKINNNNNNNSNNNNSNNNNQTTTIKRTCLLLQEKMFNKVVLLLSNCPWVGFQTFLPITEESFQSKARRFLCLI